MSPHILKFLYFPPITSLHPLQNVYPLGQCGRMGLEVKLILNMRSLTLPNSLDLQSLTERRNKVVSQSIFLLTKLSGQILYLFKFLWNLSIPTGSGHLLKMLFFFFTHSLAQGFIRKGKEMTIRTQGGMSVFIRSCLLTISNSDQICSFCGPAQWGECIQSKFSHLDEGVHSDHSASMHWGGSALKSP